MESPETAVRFARLVNDAFADVVRRKRGRFAALATLPLNDPEASVDEFDRATAASWDFAGAMLFSNVNGVRPRRPPLLAALRSGRTIWDAVLYIHPTHPVGVEAMTDYWLMPLVGFLCDTTLAAAKTRLQRRGGAVPAHSVGALPLGRRDSVPGRAAGPRLRSVQRVPRAISPSRPAEYLKQLLLRHRKLRPQGALELAIAFAGARPHPRGQRLSAPDRQHPLHAGKHRSPRYIRNRPRRDPRRQRRSATGVVVCSARLSTFDFRLFVLAFRYPPVPPIAGAIGETRHSLSIPA